MSDGIDIDLVRKGTCSVLHVAGDIVWQTAPALRVVILELFKERGQLCVIVDLQRTKHVDSSGVSTFLEGLHAAKARHGSLVLCGLNESIRRLLDLTRLSRAFEITDTVDHALGLQGALTTWC